MLGHVHRAVALDIGSGPEYAPTVIVRTGAAEGGLLDDGAWGLGWRVNHATGVPVLGTTAGGAFGAHGSTGCMAWADPRSGLCVVLLTPEPDLCYSAEFNHLSDLLQRAVIQP